jgi:hypothetical protein
LAGAGVEAHVPCGQRLAELGEHRFQRRRCEKKRRVKTR